MDDTMQLAHVRTKMEVRPILEALAKRFGAFNAVELTVVYAGDALFFADGAGEPVRDGNSHVLAATDEEIATGDYLKLFSGRALYAALALRTAEAAIAARLSPDN